MELWVEASRSAGNSFNISSILKLFALLFRSSSYILALLSSLNNWTKSAYFSMILLPLLCQIGSNISMHNSGVSLGIYSHFCVVGFQNFFLSVTASTVLFLEPSHFDFSIRDLRIDLPCAIHVSVPRHGGKLWKDREQNRKHGFTNSFGSTDTLIRKKDLLFSVF